MSFASYLNGLYADYFDVIREIEAENDDGTTGSAEKVILENVPCRVSAKTRDERDRTSPDVDMVMQRLTIFCSPEHRICKGDKIIARKTLNGAVVSTYKGYAGEPFVYDLAQQFVLLEERTKNGLLL